MAELCRPLREDGPWRELPGSASDLTEALRADPDAIGVTGWHAVADSRVGLKTLAVEGTPPSPLAIATGVYPLSRPLFVYFKKSRLESLPAIQGYVNEVTSDSAWGEGGYLTNAGLVPMMLDERQQYSYIAGHSVEPVCPPSVVDPGQAQLIPVSSQRRTMADNGGAAMKAPIRGRTRTSSGAAGPGARPRRGPTGPSGPDQSAQADAALGCARIDTTPGPATGPSQEEPCPTTESSPS